MIRRLQGGDGTVAGAGGAGGGIVEPSNHVERFSAGAAVDDDLEFDDAS